MKRKRKLGRGGVGPKAQHDGLYSKLITEEAHGLNRFFRTFQTLQRMTFYTNWSDFRVNLLSESDEICRYELSICLLFQVVDLSFAVTAMMLLICRFRAYILRFKLSQNINMYMRSLNNNVERKLKRILWDQNNNFTRCVCSRASSLCLYDVIRRLLGHARWLLLGDFRLPTQLVARYKSLQNSTSGRLYGHVVIAWRAGKDYRHGGCLSLHSAVIGRDTTWVLNAHWWNKCHVTILRTSIQRVITWRHYAVTWSNVA